MSVACERHGPVVLRPCDTGTILALWSHWAMRRESSTHPLIVVAYTATCLFLLSTCSEAGPATCRRARRRNADVRTRRDRAVPTEQRARLRPRRRRHAGRERYLGADRAPRHDRRWLALGRPDVSGAGTGGGTAHHIAGLWWHVRHAAGVRDPARLRGRARPDHFD